MARRRTSGRRWTKADGYPPPEIAKLGDYLMRHYRQHAIEEFDLAWNSQNKAAAAKPMSQWLAGLSPDERDRVRRTMLHFLDGAMMNLLHMIEEDDALGGVDVQIQVDGTNVAKVTDGLAGDYVGWTRQGGPDSPCLGWDDPADG